MKALDLLSFTVTAPGATGTAMTAVSGNSAIVRNGSPGTLITCVAAWTNAQAAGFTGIAYPSGHDLVRGFQFRNTSGVSQNKIPAGYPLRFRAQDPITATQAGSATAGDVELLSMLMYYDDLNGIDAHLINLATLRARGVNLVTVRNSITPSAASIYASAQALNAGSDLLKANTEYAVLGGYVDSGVTANTLSFFGPDTGNLRIGFPCLPGLPELTNNFFVALSENHDMPLIPVINSSNRASTFIEMLANENFAASPFHLNLVELATAA